MSTRVGSHTRACGGAVVTRATRDVRVSYGVVYTRRRGRRRRRVSVASFIHGRCRSDGRPWRGGVRRAACEAVDHDDSDAGGGGSPGETWLAVVVVVFAERAKNRFAFRAIEIGSDQSKCQFTFIFYSSALASRSFGIN